jgi:hypothetical protein
MQPFWSHPYPDGEAQIPMYDPDRRFRLMKIAL